MTPKEKAEELVYKMKFPKPFPDNIVWARSCAIEAVNELLQNDHFKDDMTTLDMIKFYEDVLLEIPSVQ